VTTGRDGTGRERKEQRWYLCRDALVLGGDRLLVAAALPCRREGLGGLPRRVPLPLGAALDVAAAGHG
jgi:hypothetical protein